MIHPAAPDRSAIALANVRFSNRPFGVKRFQTIHQHSVDVAHGLVLLFGIGAKAPCMGFSLSRNLSMAAHLFSSSVSCFDLNVRFFILTRASLRSMRAESVQIRLVPICAMLALPGHTLTASSTTAR